MNTWPLSQTESANLQALNDAGLDSALLFVTATGPEKAILDATVPMRELFIANRFHDYTTQAVGPAAKVLKGVILWNDVKPSGLVLSLYRPKTKKGDPRMWPYGFKEFTAGNEVFASFFWDGEMHLISLTRGKAAQESSGVSNSQLAEMLSRAREKTRTTSNELLAQLKLIASAGPLKAVCKGDTAVGRSIECALGIPINSSRNPDYKGIEIKCGRSELLGRENRANLFACVPTWAVSECKSSEEILNRFGYVRNGRQQLYCTVSTRRPNSQGLQLSLDDAVSLLKEISPKTSPRDVCVWPLEKLHERLGEKHKETFWIEADTTTDNDCEWFRLRSVTHTRAPSFPQFDRLLDDGTITVDHLIARTPAGGVKEKGPLFKIERPRLTELFLGKPATHSLL